MSRLSGISVHDLGSYLREQREHAQLSLRQLADVAGISNPYLSQIERGLKHPSAEILQALARALRISAESLYVRAGLLEEDLPSLHVRAAVLADPALTDRQRRVLLDVYDSFVDGQRTPPPGEPALVAPAAQVTTTDPHPEGARP
ncbi:MAG TPA: helix-turn-helix transcriptional regulator [Dermatophilaceae bacterium]|nr:helix-turn-helix transcriptional regulator [Dermatophilaceae bacterium]